MDEMRKPQGKIPIWETWV